MNDNFIDSNVFVYLFDESDANKFEVASRLVDETLAGGIAAIIY